MTETTSTITTPNFGAMDMAQLREIYGEMRDTCIDMGHKVAELPGLATLSDVRQQCINLHRFIQVRKTTAKVDNVKAKAKKTETTSPKNKEQTMTTKKTAAKKKAATKKVATPKFAGYPMTAKVHVLNKDNPARKNTGKWKRWSALLNGGTRTMEALKKAKTNPGTLRNAVKSRHVKVVV